MWDQEPAFFAGSLKTLHMLNQALHFEKLKAKAGRVCLTAETSEDQVEVQYLGKWDTG